MKNRIVEWLCGDMARGCMIGAGAATSLCVMLGPCVVAMILVLAAVAWIVYQNGRGPGRGDAIDV